MAGFSRQWRTCCSRACRTIVSWKCCTPNEAITEQRAPTLRLMGGRKPAVFLSAIKVGASVPWDWWKRRWPNNQFIMLLNHSTTHAVQAVLTRANWFTSTYRHSTSLSDTDSAVRPEARAKKCTQIEKMQPGSLNKPQKVHGQARLRV